MTIGMILAGDRGSRMGPLATMQSKGMIPIAHRPHIVHQLEKLAKYSVTHTYIITGANNVVQIRNLVKQVDAKATVIQECLPPGPIGPVAAIKYGLDVSNLDPREDVIVMMSDSYLGEEIPVKANSWVGVSHAEPNRSWCYYKAGIYYDGIPKDTELAIVSIGIYRFARADLLLAACFRAVKTTQYDDPTTTEVGMAIMLNIYSAMDNTATIQHLLTWRDIGDVSSLATANKSLFVSRPHNDLCITQHGTIVKTMSPHSSQLRYMRDLMESDDIGRRRLFPQIFNVTDTSYEMDYVNGPTLAELFLYWPSVESAWVHIMRNVISTLDHSMWRVAKVEYDKTMDHWFRQKAIDRVTTYRGKNPTIGQMDLIDNAVDIMGFSTFVYGHGDLNWNNIVYDLGTGTFKLLDPRGDSIVPLIYEIAKLRYSYRGFAQITHNLPFISGLHPLHIKAICSPSLPILDSVFTDMFTVEELTAAEGLILISAAPLHDKYQAKWLYNLGWQRLKEIK